MWAAQASKELPSTFKQRLTSYSSKQSST
jgi:hypothetical protein